jgi:hypothetical protein
LSTARSPPSNWNRGEGNWPFWGIVVVVDSRQFEITLRGGKLAVEMPYFLNCQTYREFEHICCRKGPECIGVPSHYCPAKCIINWHVTNCGN